MVDLLLSRLQGDWTQGQIKHNVVFLALPILIAMFLQNVINVIDIYWVGQLGAKAVAAVSMSGMLLMVVMMLMMGISTGTVAMIARAVGQEDAHQANNVATQSINLAIVAYMILAAFGLILARVLLEAIGAPAEVLGSAVQYLRLSILGGVFVFLMILGSAILRGVGDTVTPLIVFGIVAFLNLILDPILIFGIGVPRFEVNGAALASVISQGVGAVVLFFILLARHPRITVSLKIYGFDVPIMKRLLKIGIPSSLQMTSRSLMWVALMMIVSGFGTAAIAAYGITMRIMMVILLPAFALGAASATLVGQNLGSGDQHRAQQSALWATLYDVVLMVLASIIFFAFAHQIMAFFNDEQDVLAIGAALLRIVSPTFVCVAIAVILGRSLNGAGETMSTMLVTVGVLWGIQIPLAYVLANMTGFGLNGVWISMALTHIIQAVLIVMIFFQGAWKEKQV